MATSQTSSHLLLKLPAPRVLLAATCILQFLVWFKPSEQYFVNVVPVWFGISVQDVTHTLFVHSLYAPFVTFPVLFGVYRFGGYSSALLLTTAAAAITPALVVFGAPHMTAAVLSQWTWALHFAALFVTVGMLYSFLPPAWYMRAAAANTTTMLIASTMSSATGLFMVQLPRSAGGNGSSSHSDLPNMELTFYVSAASSAAGCLWLLLCMARGWIPTPYTPACESMRRKAAALVGDPPIPPSGREGGTSPCSLSTGDLDPTEAEKYDEHAVHPASSSIWPSTAVISLAVQPTSLASPSAAGATNSSLGSLSAAAVAQLPPCAAAPATHALLTVPRIWRWVVPSFMIRGVHTLVIEMWPALSQHRFPELQSWNAAIGLGAYIAAAMAVLLAGQVLATRSARVSQYAVLASIMASSACLLAVGFLQRGDTPPPAAAMTVMGTLIAAYNLTAEIALAVSSAQTAHEVFRILSSAGYLPSQPSASAATQPANDATGRQSGRGFSITSTVLGALGGGQWAFVLGVQALLAEAWQLVVQFTLWPHGVWPLDSNPYAMQLSLSDQFIGFGVFAAFAGLLSLALHGVPLELFLPACVPRCRHTAASEKLQGIEADLEVQLLSVNTPLDKAGTAADRAELMEDALCPTLWRSCGR